MHIRSAFGSRKGMTLVEIMVTMATIVLIIGVALYAFIVLSAGWHVQHTRTGLNIRLDRTMDKMARDIRHADEAAAVHDDELRYATEETGSIAYHIYYLYSPSDSYPPSFGDTSYQLRRADLTGGLYGTFTYGDGAIITGDVAPPDVSDISLNGNMVTIDLTLSRGSEVIRSRTRVRPRNLE